MVAARISKTQLGLMTKVAKLYYEQSMKQPAIAERLGISQSRVSRLLTQALELGVVRIIVVTPDQVYADLEDALRTKLGLRDVVIGHCDADTEDAILGAIGSAGAAYLESTLSPRDHVGISSWSSTLLAVAESMQSRNTPVVEVVQIQGGIGNARAQVLATRLTERFARITQSEPRYVAAPGLVASQAVRDGLLGDPYLRDAVSSWRQLNVILLGIGALEPSALLRESGNIINDDDLAELRRQGAVGDVCSHFFGAEGAEAGAFLDDRLIGLSRENLKAVDRKVGFAGGQRKLEAIAAAAKGGWIDVLVTDSITAAKLLEI